MQLYPASVVAPLALLVPLMTIALDVLLLGEALTLPILVGTAIAIAGFILVLRGQPTARLAPSAP
ncbi:EamA-like transporter family protein [compost metagenome]